jgi:hypothetical protein
LVACRDEENAPLVEKMQEHILRSADVNICKLSLVSIR